MAAPGRMCGECLARAQKLLCGDDMQSYAGTLLGLPSKGAALRKHFLCMASNVHVPGGFSYCSNGGCACMTYMVHEATALSKAWPSTHVLDCERGKQIKHAVQCLRQANAGFKPQRRMDRRQKKKKSA